MEYRPLNIVLISAAGLKKSTLMSKNMDVYAVASISGTTQKIKTTIHKNGGTNPTWNFPMKFIIDEAAALQNRLTLVVKIKAGWIFGGWSLGEVHVPVKELLEGEGKGMQNVSYQVIRPSGKPKGVVCFKYEFGERFVRKVEEPVTAYPPPPRGVGVGSSSGYPAYGYPYQQPYQQPGSYPAPVAPPRRSGMGFGTGLLGGALGGMLIGDMMSSGGCGGGCGGCGGGCGGGGCGGF